MRFSGCTAAVLVLVTFLTRQPPIIAREPVSAPPAAGNSPEATTSEPVASTAGNTSSASDDWAAFAKALPTFGPDRMVGKAMLFDIESGRLLGSLRRYGDNLRHVRFSPDGEFALLSFCDTCVLWNLDGGDVAQEFDQGGIAEFSPDGSSILIYGEHQATRQQVATGKAVETIQLPGGRGFNSRYSRINAHLANEERRDASGTLIYNSHSSTYQPIVDAATGKEAGLCPDNTLGCMVSGATKTVLQGGPLHPLNVVRVFDFARQEIARFDMPIGAFEGIGGELRAVSRDGKQFLYARPAKEGGDNPGPKARFLTRQYSVHDAATGKEVKALGEFDSNYTAHFSPDGRRVVLLPTFGYHADDARDPEILVIDTATGAVNRRIYSGPWALPSLDFDAGGSRMLVAGAMNLAFWRNSAGWRQWEQQNPMPRKVIDALKIVKEGSAGDEN